MNPLIEKLLLLALKQLITDQVVKEAEVQLVAFLKDLAAKSDNKIDDFMVQVIAEALGVHV